MHSHSLEDRAKALILKLTSGCDDYYGRGCMSPAVYDTAWVSMISKSDSHSKHWLFPECFTHILEQQRDDGSWVSYASQIDGILNTAASLLALKKHANELQHQPQSAMQSLNERIERATAALGSLLKEWQVDATVHVGFEILVPALLIYLEQEGLRFEFPGREQLYEINAKKLAKFKPEYLYMDMKTTALHSLEAFIGKLDFDRIRHHKVRGAFMASPSSTAAYLMNSSTWDDDCEAYLKNVVVSGAGNETGGMPCAFPSSIFELTWAFSTLLEGGVALSEIAPLQTSKAADFLRNAFTEEKGLLGFAPYVGADADDTAKTILSLNLMGCPTSPQTLMQEFEDKTHFKTYQQERDPSFSANCNVLNALLHVETPSNYTVQIEKTLKFLCTTFRQSGNTVRDKWNLSLFYPVMLMMQASIRLLELWKAGCLSNFPENLITQTLYPVLSDLSTKTLSFQNRNGSWGDQSLQEETAYAVLVLVYSLHLPSMQHLNEELHLAIENGRAFLRSSTKAAREYLWVEKVTYASEVLSESYVLAALHIPVPILGHDSPVSVIDPHLWTNDNAVRESNGSETNKNTSPSIWTNEKAVLESDSLRTNEIAESTLWKNDNSGSMVDGVRPHKINSENANESNGAVINGTRTSKSQETDTLGFYQSETRIEIKAASKPTWSSENERVLLAPFTYLEQQPGKDIRTLSIQAFNAWLNVPPESLKIITNVVKMLHTASLLVDDIEDSSVLRRGVPVAHSIFGVAQTFNSGNYVYFLALQEVQKLRQPQATNIFMEELLSLHRGQGMDLYWRESLICPSEHEYLDMVGNKTGGLFRLVVKLMEAESPHRRQCGQLVDLMSRIFQIRDDYKNLYSTVYTEKKGLCEDLTEGKFSFPIIHSIRSDPDNHELVNILKQKSSEERIKLYAITIMERTGSFSYTRGFVQNLKTQADELISGYEAQGWGSGEGVRKILVRMDMD